MLAVNLNIKVSKIMYQWILALNPFCFCETKYLNFTTRVFGHSAITPFLGGRIQTQRSGYFSRTESCLYMDSRALLCRIWWRQIVDWHNWGPTTSYSLCPPRSPGYSLLFVNYDHRSSIGKPVCVVLVLNTCGESKSSAFGVGLSRSQKTFFGMQQLSQNRFSQNDLQENHFS